MRLLETLRAREERKFWVLALWLLAVFLIGGGSRDDITSLVILRPLSAVVLAAAAYKVSVSDLRTYRSLIAIVAAIIGLVAAHLVPLPPVIWQQLPQRGLIAEIDRVAGLGTIWRPLSIAPPRTWNALFSLMVPLSVILLAVRLNAKQISRTTLVVLAIGMLSVILGTLQVAGGAKALYFYSIHNPGSANGLFANRNHQGAFLACLLPLLAVLATGRSPDRTRGQSRTIIAATAALTLVPVLLITGSRAGLVLGVLGFAGTALVVRWSDTAASRQAGALAGGKRLGDKRYLFAGFGLAVVVLGVVTAFLSRAEALRRLLRSSEAEELRVTALKPVAQLAVDYMPFGSGAGTFVEAFFRAEPKSFLSPTYFNHAHFDFLEWAVTGGVPALVILAVAIDVAVAWAVHLFARAKVGDPGVQLGRAGLIIVALLAAASTVDYPLRTPALSALVALAAVWVCQAGLRPKRSDQPG